jgi:hypothetical protein
MQHWQTCVDEGGISSAGCDGCGSHYQQTLYPGHGFMQAVKGKGPHDVLLHLDLCADCVMYLANGEEPENWQP